MDIEIDPRQFTHVPYLIEAVQKTTGPLLELGAGMGSTPLLHALGSYYDRGVLTIEEDSTWMEWFASKFRDEGHVFLSEADENVWNYPWGVVLIDGFQTTRGIAASKLWRAELLVIHDTEHAQAYPGLEAALHKMKSQETYTQLEPWTTVASHTRDSI